MPVKQVQAEVAQCDGCHKTQVLDDLALPKGWMVLHVDTEHVNQEPGDHNFPEIVVCNLRPCIKKAVVAHIDPADEVDQVVSDSVEADDSGDDEE